MIHLEWRLETAADGTAPKTPPVRFCHYPHLTSRILEGQMVTGKTPTVNLPVSLLGAVVNVGQPNI